MDAPSKLLLFFQLETSPATIDVLPSIREAVGPDVEIILDGGVQRGVDIVKGLALGADAVGVGKPYVVDIPDVLGILNIHHFMVNFNVHFQSTWLVITMVRVGGQYSASLTITVFPPSMYNPLYLFARSFSRYLYGLAAGGYDGVDKAMTILHTELERAMGLLGTGTVEDLKKRGPGLLNRRGPSARNYPSIGARRCMGPRESGDW